MAHERDLFANFERMRREMDVLFGDVLERRHGTRGRSGFSPPVDVFYTDDPPRAIVVAEVAGIDPADLELEIRGRELVLAGHRRPQAAEGRVYQQLEIESGPFRRIVSLGADVDADATRASYEDGFLRVELPLTRPATGKRTVPVETPSRGEEPEA